MWIKKTKKNIKDKIQKKVTCPPSKNKWAKQTEGPRWGADWYRSAGK